MGCWQHPRAAKLGWVGLGRVYSRGGGGRVEGGGEAGDGWTWGLKSTGGEGRENTNNVALVRKERLSLVFIE